MTCHPSGTHTAADKANQEHCNAFHGPILVSLEALVGFFEDHGEAVTAAFTIVLAISTIGLWVSTRDLWTAGENQIALIKENVDKELAQNREIAQGNWDQMSESIAAAIEAGKAAAIQADSAARQAKVAEDTFAKLERPYVIVTNLSIIKPSKTTVNLVINGPHITYKVGNYGRMPAIIHDIRNVFQVAEIIKTPDNPFSSVPPHRLLSEGFNAGYAIGAGAILPDDQIFYLPGHIDFEERSGWYAPKLSRGHTIFMFVKIRYEDTGDLVRDAVSTWRYDLSTHYFLRYGGKEYNYEKEADDIPK